MHVQASPFLLKKLFHQHLLDEGVREDHILVIDMESRKNREFKNPDYLLDWVEKMMIDYETYYIIIDEVQEVEDFVEVLSSLSVTEGADVYVTGSNSRFLSSDLVTEFRGRGDEIHVWPLSFKEFMTVYDGSKEDGWAEYRLYGGLPQLLTQVGDEKKADFLRRLYRTVYLRDIYERNNIELRPEFEELSKTVASSIGAPVNALNIANTFKSVSNVQSITDKTVSAYLEYMQDAFLIEKSERFDIKGRKYIGSLSKYYYQDVGLRNAILSFRQSEPTHIMPTMSLVLSHVILQLKDCVFRVSIQAKVFVEVTSTWSEITDPESSKVRMGGKGFCLQQGRSEGSTSSTRPRGVCPMQKKVENRRTVVASCMDSIPQTADRTIRRR